MIVIGAPFHVRFNSRGEAVKVQLYEKTRKHLFIIKGLTPKDVNGLIFNGTQKFEIGL